MIVTAGETMTRRRNSTLPEGTRKRGCEVLGTKAKAQRVDRSEKARERMYDLMAEHPESAEELLERVRIAEKRLAKEGNPLGIDGPKPELHPAVVRKLDTQAKKAAGMQLRRIRAHDGSVQEVWTFSASYHAMGFQDHQIAAAERFGRDWEGAYRTLRGQGFEPGVDGGGARHAMHFTQVDAQTRLAACREYLGTRAYQIVVAVVVYGATARQVHKLGGKEHRTVKSDMDVAFNDLAAFYTGTRRKDRTWDAIERFNEERAALIEAAEREVG